MIDQGFVRRLAFIKYLHNVGIQQSLKPEPMNSASVLTFHDSVELFLDLTCRFLNISVKSSTEFMQYWNPIEAKLSGELLSQRVSMERLNKARVGLKHSGVIPSKLVIEEYRVNTSTFFKDNTQLVFNLDFDSISMIDLIQSQRVREKLEEADQAMLNGELGKSMQLLSIAFELLIEDYEKSRTTFYFGQQMGPHESMSMGFKPFDKVARFIDKAGESIMLLTNVIKIMSLGIDYKRYSIFKRLAREPIEIGDEYVLLPEDQFNCSLDDCKYCNNFVIETALRLESEL